MTNLRNLRSDSTEVLPSTLPVSVVKAICGAILMLLLGVACLGQELPVLDTSSSYAAAFRCEVSGADAKSSQAPVGGNGGTIDIRSGVVVDSGDGRDGDLILSTTLSGGSYQFRQVSPVSEIQVGTFQVFEPQVLTIDGEVVIRCQNIFAPTRIVGVFKPSGPRPKLTVYAGQARYRASIAGVKGTISSYHGEVGFHARDPDDSYSPTRVQFRPAANARDLTDWSGGDFVFWTSQRGPLRVRAFSRGGHGYGFPFLHDLTTPSFRGHGGAGGDVTLMATCSSLVASLDLSGGNAGGYLAEGSHGGNGGRAAINAAILLNDDSYWPDPFQIVARGGHGTRGVSASSLHDIEAQPGGRGGDGGLVAFSEGSVSHITPQSDFKTLALSGGDGGDGGDGRGDGNGGDGGRGGLPGEVTTLPRNASLLARGGNGGDGGQGGVESSSTGTGGNGGTGGDAGAADSKPGAGGLPGTGGTRGRDGGVTTDIPRQFLALPPVYPCNRQPLRITSPRPSNPNGAVAPRSQFIYLQGTGPPGTRYEIRVSDIGLMVPHSVSGTVGAEGRWEHVVLLTVWAERLDLYEEGASVPADSLFVAAAPKFPIPSGADFEQLQRADVLLSFGGFSAHIQQQLHGGFYSHSFIFVGSTETNGTPEIAEASGVGNVSRIISLDEAISHCGKVAIYRYINPDAAFSEAQRDSVCFAAIQHARGRWPYWDITSDFGLYCLAEQYYNIGHLRLFACIGAIKSLISRTDKFICTTLVWRAFLDGTGQDIAVPNVPPPSAIPVGLRLIGSSYLKFLASHNAIILPDTLALSGKLTFVSGTPL